MTFIEVAKTHEIPDGKMKHYEVNGKEVFVANVEGKYYAASDRCPHANASLSMGMLDGTTAVCPLHFARFNIMTGELLSRPVEMELGGVSGLPPEFIQTMARIGEIVSKIKTNDLRVYPVKVQGSSVLVNVD